MSHKNSHSEDDNPYKILGLSIKATQDEIKASYRKLSIKWHPDKNPTNRDEATKTFQKIASAYNILNDPKKKQIYDLHGQEGLDMFDKGIDVTQAGASPFGNGFPFGFFQGQNARQQIQKCSPTVFKLRLSLSELYRGGPYKLNYPCKYGCESCEGTGSTTKKLETCSSCNGRGSKVLKRNFPNGMVQMMEQVCGACAGQGKLADPKNACTICQGKAYVLKSKEADFNVYPGMQWKMQIGLESAGDELRDQIPGDLVVLLLPKNGGDQEDPTGSESDVDDDDNNGKQTWVKVADSSDVDLELDNLDDSRMHDNVRSMSKPKRNGGDLIYKFHIPLVDALTGLKYKFIHPGSGEVLVIDHPDVIKAGSIYIIHGKGMPVLNQAAVARRVPLNQLNNSYGNIVIEFDVIFPTKVNKKSAEVLQALLGKGLSNNDYVFKGATKDKPQTKRNEILVTLNRVEKRENIENESENENSGPRMAQGPQCAQQ